VRLSKIGLNFKIPPRQTPAAVTWRSGWACQAQLQGGHDRCGGLTGGILALRDPTRVAGNLRR
jgi:hypothetical protein